MLIVVGQDRQHAERKFNIFPQWQQTDFPVDFSRVFRTFHSDLLAGALVLAGMMERLRLLVQFNVTSSLRQTRELETLGFSS